MNSLHYRSLQIVYPDFISTFQQLLEKAGAVTIHHRNIRLLATEMYKVPLATRFKNLIKKDVVGSLGRGYNPNL